MSARLNIGDRVVFHKWPLPREAAHMVVDVSPCGERVVLAYLDPESGQPEEFTTRAADWRPV